MHLWKKNSLHLCSWYFSRDHQNVAHVRNLAHCLFLANKVLLEYSHTHSLAYGLRLFWYCNSRGEWLKKRTTLLSKCLPKFLCWNCDSPWGSMVMSGGLCHMHKWVNYLWNGFAKKDYVCPFLCCGSLALCHEVMEQEGTQCHTPGVPG